jgi:hypothetical protein
MADYPCNFVFNAITKQLNWDGVSGAESYEIVTRQIAPSQTDWQEAYSGPLTNCLFVVLSGTYSVKGRKIGPPGVLGEFGPEEMITVSPAS